MEGFEPVLRRGVLVLKIATIEGSGLLGQVIYVGTNDIFPTNWTDSLLRSRFDPRLPFHPKFRSNGENGRYGGQST